MDGFSHSWIQQFSDIIIYSFIHSTNIHYAPAVGKGTGDVAVAKRDINPFPEAAESLMEEDTISKEIKKYEKC